MRHEFDKKYWLGWSDAYIEDVIKETPSNFTDEYREKIALWLFKMSLEQHNNWKRAEAIFK